MSIKNILFDLDGTLLPMDQDYFISTYLGALAKKMICRGYDPKDFAATIMQGIKVMIKNDGSVTNETAFWNMYTSVYGERSRDDEEFLRVFYETEFQQFRSICGYEPRAKSLIDKIKASGLRLVLATNPLFPRIATESRIKWAGLDYNDFELVTTYENIGYSKPYPEYYTEIAKRLNMDPAECLMIGNDVRDDMSALLSGMNVFLLTDGLINVKNVDISVYPNGNFDALVKHIDSIIEQR